LGAKFNKEFEEKFIAVCKTALSLTKAAETLNLNYKTVVKHAKRLNCFVKNQSGKGINKKQNTGVILTSDILNNRVLFQSYKLKNRLFEENIKQKKCESCQNTEWLGKPIPLELHHINGNKNDNSLSNLSILCPNCHAQTSNYRAKNIKNLSALLETTDVESLKFGETLSATAAGNPEPSPSQGEGVET